MGEFIWEHFCPTTNKRASDDWDARLSLDSQAHLLSLHAVEMQYTRKCVVRYVSKNGEFSLLSKLGLGCNSIERWTSYFQQFINCSLSLQEVPEFRL